MVVSPGASFGIEWADGARHVLEATDDAAWSALAGLAAVTDLVPPRFPGGVRFLVRGSGEHASAAEGRSVVSNVALRVRRGTSLTGRDWSGEVECTLPETGLNDALLPIYLLNVPASFAIRRGGLLVHAALVVYAGGGFLLAGRSAAGKSTASRLLPSPWEALCDDTVLLVRDAHGGWQAHPWPTWSRVISEGAGGWPLERAVPLEGIYFLEQAEREETVALGRAQAACLLNEVAQQASLLLAEGMSPAQVRELRLRQFDNVTRLAQGIACHRLRFSLHGAFWESIVSTKEGLRACAAP